MCSQLLNRHICTHAIPGLLQPCAIRHLPHPVIPLTVQLSTPCPTCASHSFNSAFFYSQSQPFLPFLRFQPANMVLQPQQIYLPGSAPMLFQPRLAPPSWAPLARMYQLQIQPQVVVPMHGYGQPVWTFGSTIPPPYYPAYPQPHPHSNSTPPNSTPPTQPQKIPGPGSCNTPLPIPAGIPNSIRTETINGVPQEVKHHHFYGNQIPGTGVTRQGWNDAHGHDAGSLPPGWAVSSGAALGPADEGPRETENPRIWDEVDMGAGGVGRVSREEADEAHHRRHEEYWNGNERTDEAHHRRHEEYWNGNERTDEAHHRRHEEYWDGNEGTDASSSTPIHVNTDQAVGPASGEPDIPLLSSSSSTSQNMEVEDEKIYYSVYEPSSPGAAFNDQEFEGSGDLDMEAMVENVGDLYGAE